MGFSERRVHSEAVRLIERVRPWLQEHRGVLPAQVQVLSTSVRRHTTALVGLPSGVVYFVKMQGRPLIAEALSLEQECTFYEFARSSSSPAFSGVIPHYHFISKERDFIVQDGFRHASTIHELILFGGNVSETVWKNIGEWLAQLHGKHLIDEPISKSRLCQPIATHGNVSPSAFGSASAAFHEYLACLQAHPWINERLRHLEAQWTVDGFIHGDLKLDNILLFSGDKKQNFYVVDWENSGKGDRFWDCGAFVGSLFLAMVQRVARSQERSVESFEYNTCLSAVRSFLLAYVSATHAPHFSRSRAETAVGLVFAWAGWWLLHWVRASLPTRRSLHPIDLSVIRLSIELLAEPDFDELS